MKTVNKVLISGIGFLVLFFLVGYRLSDNYLATNIVEQNRLTSPAQVFDYVIKRKIQAPPGAPNNAAGASFRELIDRDGGWLWCDEGAIVVAVLVNRLHFQTQLVDLLHRDSHVSQHTVLQIYEAGRWITYDFTGRQYNIPLDRTVNYPMTPVVRAYPAWYHKIMLNNFFIRFVGQKIRPYLKSV